MLTIDLAGERMTLLPQRAVHWPGARALLVADLHLGKTAAFRSFGAPVPEAATGADLRRLDGLLTSTGAERIIVLGDLIHSRAGRAECTMAEVGEWAHRAHARGVSITLVRGNHDRSAGDPPPEWRISCVDAPAHEGPFAWRHEPLETPDAYTLAGHLHPAVTMDCPTGAALRARCFWFGDRIGVLPAFGSFTGSKVFRPALRDRVFITGEGAVVEASARRDAPSRPRTSRTA